MGLPGYFPYLAYCPLLRFPAVLLSCQKKETWGLFPQPNLIALGQAPSRRFCQMREREVGHMLLHTWKYQIFFSLPTAEKNGVKNSICYWGGRQSEPAALLYQF